MTRKLSLQRRARAGQPSGWPPDVPKVMQDIYAARGVLSPEGVQQTLALLHAPTELGGIEKAAQILGDAIIADKYITVAGDYDCDGATGSAVGVRGLRMLGAKKVSFVVPHRHTHGYGLSPGLVESMPPTTEVIVTVDSGVSSIEGVAYAKALGRTVVITDHHLPGETLPAADAIVNPNLKGDSFPSKALAGVGVMFYVLLRVRAYLRDKGFWTGKEPDLAELLDLVAVGTVADMVSLDHNNRILIQAGLRRIRSGMACVGLKALMEVSGCDPAKLIASDIGFNIAPRLNAAGRLEHMALGVETLITDDPVVAKTNSAELEGINATRKEMQADMVAEAEQLVLEMETTDAVGVVVFRPNWHSGIVGLVASRLKDSMYRPVVAFAPAGEGSDEVRGSARSIAGLHLRDALAVVDVRAPGLIPKFGGHAGAAGLSLKLADVDRFAKLFDEVVRETLTEEQLNPVVYTDGELPAGYVNLDFARYVRECGPWGQSFAEPVFENTFYVNDCRVIKDKHLSTGLTDPRDGSYVQGIFFSGYDGGDEPTGGLIRIAYELNIRTWRGNESLQLMIRHMERLPS